MRRIAFILLALFLVLIMSGCGSPEQSVKMFLKYLIKQDAEAAKLYCTHEMDGLVDQGDITPRYLGFDAPMGAMITWGSVKGTISLATKSQTPEEAVLSMRSVLGNVTYHLRKEGGMWKIARIEGIEEDLTVADVEEQIIEGITGLIEGMGSE